MYDYMHREIINDDSLYDFHEELCSLWIRFDFALLIINIITLPNP